MNFLTSVRFFLVATAVFTLANAYPGNTISGGANSEISYGNINITAKWTWLYPVNTSEPENDTVLWDTVLPIHGVQPRDHQQTNWCMRIGVQFEKTNFSRFQLTNKCCKNHVEAVFVDIDDNLLHRCTDESAFYDCLKKVNTTMSRTIGHHYFSGTTIYCYNIEREDYCQGPLCSPIMKISTNALPAF